MTNNGLISSSNTIAVESSSTVTPLLDYNLL